MEIFKNAIGLIDFLKEISLLRRKTIRDIRDYEEVMWLSKVPNENKGCFSRSFGDDPEYEEAIWVEVTKSQEPILKRPPVECNNWFLEESLKNADDVPTLQETIFEIKSETNPDYDPDDPESEEFIDVKVQKNINEFPEIESLWNEYLEADWLDWAEEYNKWEKVHAVYSKLFSIYSKQIKLGEEYELVLGIGLLQWQDSNTQNIKRHLLTANAKLYFEPSRGRFTVGPPIEGAKLRYELDMLDSADQPQKIKETFDDQLKSAEDNPWYRTIIDAVLNSFSNIISKKGRGEYFSGEHNPLGAIDKDKPKICFAPALILRKRSVRGYHEALENIESPPVF